MRRPSRVVSRWKWESDRNFNDPHYKEWRKSVFRRDKGCCQFPGCKSRKRPQAHHVLTWSAYPLLRFEVSNGIILCRIHHDMIKGNEDHYIKLFMQIIKDGNNSGH